MPVLGASSKLNKVLETAATEGVDKALEAFGDSVTVREATALRGLSSDELKALARLNKKLEDAGVDAFAGPAAYNINNG